MPPPEAPHRSLWIRATPRHPASPVEEGVLVARSALRLAVKNRVIMATLRDGAPWDDIVMTELARAEVETLITEMVETAVRLEASSTTPIRGLGRSRKTLANLRQDARRQGERASILRRVIAQLRRLEDDPEQTRALLDIAREDTLNELTQARLIPSGRELSEEELRASIEGSRTT